jgi:hypothetical protein
VAGPREDPRRGRGGVGGCRGRTLGAGAGVGRAGGRARVRGSGSGGRRGAAARRAGPRCAPVGGGAVTGERCRVGRSGRAGGTGRRRRPRRAVVLRLVRPVSSASTRPSPSATSPRSSSTATVPPSSSRSSATPPTSVSGRRHPAEQATHEASAPHGERSTNVRPQLPLTRRPFAAVPSPVRYRMPHRAGSWRRWWAAAALRVRACRRSRRAAVSPSPVRPASRVSARTSASSGEQEGSSRCHASANRSTRVRWLRSTARHRRIGQAPTRGELQVDAGDRGRAREEGHERVHEVGEAVGPGAGGVGVDRLDGLADHLEDGLLLRPKRL